MCGCGQIFAPPGPTAGRAVAKGTAVTTPLTPAGLPASIGALRALLESGDLSVAEALVRQQQALRQDTWNCVEQVTDLPSVLPDLSLPLAGVGVAHKDIFV